MDSFVAVKKYVVIACKRGTNQEQLHRVGVNSHSTVLKNVFTLVLSKEYESTLSLMVEDKGCTFTITRRLMQSVTTLFSCF